jgi:cell division protein FtsB
MQTAHEAATDKATLKLRNENERLQTENDLLKLQVKMLVAENARIVTGKLYF